jgi:hypothetical protein
MGIVVFMEMRMRGEDAAVVGGVGAVGDKVEVREGDGGRLEEIIGEGKGGG